MSTCSYSWCVADHDRMESPEWHTADKTVEVGAFATQFNLSLDEDGPYLYWSQGDIEYEVRADQPRFMDDVVAAVTRIRDEWNLFRDQHSSRLQRDTTVTERLAEVEN